MKFLSQLQLVTTFTLAAAQSQIPLVHHPSASTVLGDFDIYQSQVSPDHSIRIKRQNATLCNTTVDQYTGWLDVGRNHLFFWYFKAENKTSSSDPSSEPLALWLTGGPGGSSMLGMLQELGPCLINEHGNGTTYNPYGWNKETALIFIDQPAGVGFSYVDEGEPLPGDSFTAAADLHLFLQAFVTQVFPEHKNGPLVITGESYAGHYLPALGAQIVSQNILHPHQPQVNLKSLAIGNGYVSPLDVAFGYWETLCTTNPGVDKPVFNTTRCDIMATNLPRCMEVARVCYANPDPAICTAAAEVCWDGVIKYYDSESYTGGRNRFDSKVVSIRMCSIATNSVVTAPCDMPDFCYKSTGLIQDYLNIPEIFDAFSVPNAVKNFSVGSEEIAEAFSLTNDVPTSFVPQVQYLLASQIDILIYQGNLDLACNTAGAKRWTANMAWKGQAEFVAKDLLPWKSDGKVVGKWKEVNVKMVDGDDKTTRFALVTVDGSGHMVPQDQPEISLDLLHRWLNGKSFD